jgi:polysaccharide deacetylase family protein (PEP-CTERM system associated)
MNILSFDIEEWYLSNDASQINQDQWPLLPARVISPTLKILDLLDRNDQKATFFILGWTAQHQKDLVQEISHRGHDIGFHGYDHSLPINQKPDLFEKELVEGLSLLEKQSGKRVSMYRAPIFSLNEQTSWVIPILLRNGITVSSSYRAYQAIPGGNVPNEPFILQGKDGTLYDFPLTISKLAGFSFVYSGSGYLRAFPLSFIRQQFIRHDYNMMYFHPRDFDLDVPKTPLLPFYRNWMNRFGNHTTAPKLEALMQSMPFLPLSRAMENLPEKMQCFDY